MLYLEDYVELIEHLPTDLREKLTDMREMDLQIHKSVENLNGQAKDLFEKCAIKKSKFSGADQTYEGIRNEYYKVLESADEKVQLANQIYDLVDRHLRKLDQELSKFKMELEADNAGITEILEQRSLELDNPVTTQRSSARERRRAHVTSSASASSSAVMPSSSGDSVMPEKRLKLDTSADSDIKAVQSLPQMHGNNSNYPEKSFIPVFDVDSSVTPTDLPEGTDMSSGVTEHSITPSSSLYEQEPSIGAHDTSIKRSASAKAVLDNSRASELAQRLNEIDHLSMESFDTSGEHISDSSLSSMLGTVIQRPSRTKKQTSKAAAWVQERQQAVSRHEQRKKESVSSGSGSQEGEGVGTEGSGEQGTASEWNCDPNEPRYCLCNQISYGEMVGCDNEKCPIEWFHYGCVGLSEAPKGKWYCPQCTQAMRRRKR